MKQKIIFATGNKGKIASLEQALGSLPVEVEQQDMDIIEPQMDEVRDIAAYKAKQAWQALKQPVIVEDGGFFVDALGGLPGPYAKYAVTKIGPQKFIEIMPTDKPRTCRWATALAFIDENGQLHTFEEDSERGTLATELAPVSDLPYAKSGFWQLYIPDGFSKPLAAMSEEEYQQFADARRKFSVYVRFAEWYAQTRNVAA